MWSSSSRDNWQRLVEAVMKREQYLELAHKSYSRDTSINTVAYDNTDQILDLEYFTASPSPHQVPLTKRPPIAQVKKNAFGLIPWKLFSPLQRRRKPKDSYLYSIPDDLQLLLTRLRSFSLRELQLATDNFSNRYILGRGGHAKIYKGRLADGSLVAVKRLEAEAVKRLTAELQEIRTHLEVSTMVVHGNVRRLYGFCFTEEECVFIFPYMANGSVASCLRDMPWGQRSLDWGTRKEIAVGTARGLAYLHDECEKRIIHCNIKAANILLDEDFKAVLGGFWDAIIMNHDSIDVIREVRGSLGHIPPEFLSHGVCSEKTDVFGYGVFLLELITGQGALDLARLVRDDDDVDLVKNLYNFKEKKWKILADPDCGGEDMEEVVEQLSVIAALCTGRSPDERPKMSEIIRMLEPGEVYGERWEAWQNQAEKEWNQFESVWGGFLPSDWPEIASRSVFPVVYAAKELYFSLCRSPILIDAGKLSFSLDKKSGKKCFMVGARELGIIWCGDTPQYWELTPHPDSRFSVVAQLNLVYWLEIRGTINTRILSSNTVYGAYLVFKLNERSRGLESANAFVRFMNDNVKGVNERSRGLESANAFVRFMNDKVKGDDERAAILGHFSQENSRARDRRTGEAPVRSGDGLTEIGVVHLQPDGSNQQQEQRGRVSVARGDGWMEVEIGSFYSGEGDGGAVEAWLLGTEGYAGKCGLIVQGIEFRPSR